MDGWMGRKKREHCEWEGQGIKAGRKDGRKEGSPLAHVEITPLQRVYIFWHHYRPEESLLGMVLLWMCIVWIARTAWMDLHVFCGRGIDRGWVCTENEAGERGRGRENAVGERRGERRGAVIRAGISTANQTTDR